MHGFDWSKWTSGAGADRLAFLPAAMEHVLGQEDGKARFSAVVRDLSRAFALCAASDEAKDMRPAFQQLSPLPSCSVSWPRSSARTPAGLWPRSRPWSCNRIRPWSEIGPGVHSWYSGSTQTVTCDSNLNRPVRHRCPCPLSNSGRLGELGRLLGLRNSRAVNTTTTVRN